VLYKSTFYLLTYLFNRSFQREVFPANHLHRYKQLNLKQTEIQRNKLNLNQQALAHLEEQLICISWAYDCVQFSSEPFRNLPSYPPDNHHSSDNV